MIFHIFYYVSIGLLVISQMINVYGSFINATNPRATTYNTYITSLPFMIIQRILNMWAVYIITFYKYMTNNQIVMTIVILQFIFTIIWSYVRLEKPIYISDYIGCVMILIGYYISINKAFTNNLLEGRLPTTPNIG